MADDAEVNAELKKRLRAADRVINQMTADAERTQAQLNMAWDLCSKQHDEIERLRAEVAELWDFIDDTPSGTESFDAWKEARRD